jgi:hypothetical protein
LNKEAKGYEKEPTVFGSYPAMREFIYFISVRL